MDADESDSIESFGYWSEKSITKPFFRLMKSAPLFKNRGIWKDRRDRIPKLRNGL